MGVDGREALERILAGNTNTPPFNPPSTANGRIIGDLSSYLILEGKQYEGIGYPNLLVAKNRLSMAQEIASSITGLGLNLSNNDLGYIGNINFDEAEKVLKELRHGMLNPRQFVDFLNLLKSGKAYDGAGKKVSKKELKSICQDIIALRDPWRAEWLGARFDQSPTGIIMTYNASPSGGSVTKDISQITLMKNKLPGISLEGWLDDANVHGLPKPNVGEGKLYYWMPIDGAVARFVAFSDGSYLYCYSDSSYRLSRLGVRVAREKN